MRKLGLAVVLALLAAAPAAEAAFPGANGRIAYQAYDVKTPADKWNFDIYTMLADGTDPRRLTSEAGGEIDPEWSPDGRRILYWNYTSSSRGGYVMGADGVGKTPVVASSENSWAPDGEHVVTGFSDIAWHRLDGSEFFAVTDDPQADDEPDWSPTGDLIAFMTYRQGGKKIATIRPDGTGLKLLTKRDAPWETMPSWSPDGSRIAFVVDGDIHTMDATGGNRTQLTFTATWPPVSQETKPAWSPDGQLIAYSYDDGIWIMPSDGSAPAQRLTPVGIVAESPDWQPLVASEACTVEGDDGPDLLTGTEGPDVICGNGGDDVLLGLEGDDLLIGGAGNDTFDGGAGADAYDGGDGIDIADYSARTESLDVTLQRSANDGEDGEGDDVRPNVETVLGGAGADTLTGSAEANRLEGGPGDDVLSGGPGVVVADELIGGDGADTADYSQREDPLTLDLDGVADDGRNEELDLIGADIENLIGGTGPDRLVGDERVNVLEGSGVDSINGGSDRIWGFDDDDVLSGDEAEIWGGTGDDQIDIGVGGGILHGEEGDDTLQGGEFVDLIDGGPGADEIFGGNGRDRVDYSTRTASVSVSLDAIADDGESGEGDLVHSDVEDITGGAGDDVLVGTGLANLLEGGVGQDQLQGGIGLDTLRGGDNDDVVDGGPDADVVKADAGNDDLDGGDGVDQLDGGTGDDLLDGGLGGDVIEGGDGIDMADYSSRTAAVKVELAKPKADGEVGEGDDVRPTVEGITGGDGADTLSGTDANNRLIGNGGADTMSGGIGDDYFDGGPGPDVFSGGQGTNLLDYSARTAPVTVTLNNLADDGEAGEGDNAKPDMRRIEGGSGDDFLNGGSNIDILRGNAGNDTLDGRGGVDQLVGGAGADTLVSRDGVAGDKLTCNGGIDGFKADLGQDIIAADCETALP